jgi:uncharacterized protein
MTRFLFTILFFLSLGLSALKVPEFSGRVVDNANLLSSEEEDRIRKAIFDLQEKTGAHMAVLIIPSLERENLEDFSLRTANAWELGIGSENNGLLLLISRDDRRIRLEVGAGLEGKIPTGKAQYIVDVMARDLRDKCFADGICLAVDKINNILKGNVKRNPLVKKLRKAYIFICDILPYIWIIFFLFLPVVFYFFLWFFVLRDSEGVHISSGGAIDMTEIMNRNGFSGYRAWDRGSISGSSSSAGGSFSSGGGGGFKGGGASGGW